MHEKWRNNKNMQNLFATSIVADKLVFGCSGDVAAKFLRCVDLETGKTHWDERLPGYAHLLGVDGRILLWEEHGTLSHFNPSAKGLEFGGELRKVLTTKSWSAPALAGGRLYLRDDKELLCLDLK